MRYAASGYEILRRVTATRWVIVYDGSEPPPCSLHTPVDLGQCMKWPPRLEATQS
jgi:hypothetical protein